MATTHKSIAFFDFDGTITHNDSFLQFLLFTHGKFGLFLRLILLSPIFILYRLKMISDHTSKEIIFASFYKNKPFDKVQAKAGYFAENIIPTYIKKDALERIHWHQDQGHEVVIVSAGFSFILKPWCDKNHLELLATEIEVIQGNISGRFSGANCWGKGKLKRIQEKFDLSEFSTIFAYGDSDGDKEMLSIAHQAFYKNFNS